MNSFVVAVPQKCIGCRTCEIACVTAHSKNNLFSLASSQIAFHPRLSVIKTAAVSAPIQCRHCEDAPCATVCTEGCIVNKNGVIYINQKNCIGCKTCIIVCPFGAIDMVEKYGDSGSRFQKEIKNASEDGVTDTKEQIVANKCDLCMERKKGPACVEVCPTDALQIVNAENIERGITDKRRQSALSLSMLA